MREREETACAGSVIHRHGPASQCLALGGHAAMKGAYCREDTHQQVDEQPPVAIDSGEWPHVCSSGARSGLVCHHSLVGKAWHLQTSWVAQDHLRKGGWGCPQAVVIQHRVTGRIQTSPLFTPCSCAPRWLKVTGRAHRGRPVGGGGLISRDRWKRLAAAGQLV